jgi:hypothetical protein
MTSLANLFGCITAVFVGKTLTDNDPGQRCTVFAKVVF